MAVFRQKVRFCRKKSATKFLCVKNVSEKIVRHSRTDLSIRAKTVRGRRPFLSENLAETDPPIQNADFQSIIARIASAVTPSE